MFSFVFESFFLVFQLERLKLFTENTKEDAGAALDLPNSSYVKILVPEDKEQSKIEPCLPSNVVSLHALRALPMQEQCKLLLKDGKRLFVILQILLYLFFVLFLKRKSFNSTNY